MNIIRQYIFYKTLLQIWYFDSNLPPLPQTIPRIIFQRKDIPKLVFYYFCIISLMRNMFLRDKVAGLCETVNCWGDTMLIDNHEPKFPVIKKLFLLNSENILSWINTPEWGESWVPLLIRNGNWVSHCLLS